MKRLALKLLMFLPILFPLFLFTAGKLYAEEYVAFSLKVAKEKILSTPEGQDYRELHKEVFELGGITVVRGLVYDRKNKDIILVGERNPERKAILTLDDFVVALRARFIHGKWPLVSIDPLENNATMQKVRFEGGIENTQFGQDLFYADYTLKEIGMGLLFPGIVLRSYWEIYKENAEKEIPKHKAINSRFWFYPVLPIISIREDVVAIQELKMGVFSEVLSAKIDGKKIKNISTFQNTAGVIFAEAVSDNFENLARVHYCFARLQGLEEIVALTKAIEGMWESPKLGWWLKNYIIKEFKTKKRVKLLKKSETYWILETAISSTEGYCEISGGIELKAIALRFKAGDVTAMKEVVLKTRPQLTSLSWSFLVGKWLIPTSLELIEKKDIVPLFSHAKFLMKKKRYGDAITLYGKIIDLKPDLELPYYMRGILYEEKRQYDRAISDCSKAIEINPKFIKAYIARGSAYHNKIQYDQAISDYNKAIEINPKFADAYINRGSAYFDKGLHSQAISDFNKALEINPNLFEAYYNRGIVYFKKYQYDKAILDFDMTIEINPIFAEAYIYRGIIYMKIEDRRKSCSDWKKAYELGIYRYYTTAQKDNLCE